MTYLGGTLGLFGVVVLSTYPAGVKLRWYSVDEWLLLRGSGRKIEDVERPCSICLLDLDLASMSVAGPDGRGVAYLICNACRMLYRSPTEAWVRADKWVASLTEGFGSQDYHHQS